jgi:hypothetical protein
MLQKLHIRMDKTVIKHEITSIFKDHKLLYIHANK